MYVTDQIIKALDKDMRFEIILSWVYQYYVTYSFRTEGTHAMKYPSTLETKEEGGSEHPQTSGKSISVVVHMQFHPHHY